jgi:hypothetical protein
MCWILGKKPIEKTKKKLNYLWHQMHHGKNLQKNLEVFPWLPLTLKVIWQNKSKELMRNGLLRAPISRALAPRGPWWHLGFQGRSDDGFGANLSWGWPPRVSLSMMA